MNQAVKLAPSWASSRSEFWRPRILKEKAENRPTPLLLVHRMFEEQVRRTPNAIALCTSDSRLTYRALNRRANRLARKLTALDVGPEVPVGLFSFGVVRRRWSLPSWPS